ncbi:MAG: helix-turn-helix domain-containing protein [Promethearchaeota archaeon]
MSFCEEIVVHTVQVLINSNYHVIEYPEKLDLCFELIARHISGKTPSLVIKIVENIDNIRSYYLNELKIVSHLIHALPLLIGVKNRRNNLIDGIIYLRDNLISVNLPTFTQVIQNPILPMAIAKKGGFFYNIDGDKIVRLRSDKQITQKELAEQMDLSSKAIGSYEKGRMRASHEHAEKLKNILGESVVLPLDFFDILQDTISSFKLKENLQRRITKKTQEFMKEINEIVSDTGLKVYWTRTSPYDLFIYDEPEEENTPIDYKLVGGTKIDPNEDKAILEFKSRFFPNISVLQADGVIIVNDELLDIDQIKEYRIPYIFPKELRELENPEQFHKKIKKRVYR